MTRTEEIRAEAIVHLINHLVMPALRDGTWTNEIANDFMQDVATWDTDRLVAFTERTVR